MTGDGLLKVGLVGVDTSHAGAFADALSRPPLADVARLAWVWGDEVRPDQPDARVLARQHGINDVLSSPTDRLDGTDLVLIVSDGGGGTRHGALARPFIEAGIATFIDKPMTTDLREAHELFSLAAEHDTPIMSSSALRHADELRRARPEIDGAGTISSAISTGPGDWFYYGIHAVELLVAAVGPGVTSVRRFAEVERDVALLSFGDGGPTAIVQTLRDAAYGFGLALYGSASRLSFDVTDSRSYYRNQLADAVAMASSRVMAIPPSETLEILTILHAGILSNARGGDPVSMIEAAATLGS